MQGDTANSRDSAITESETLLSNTSGPIQHSSSPFFQQIVDKPSRSGIISKPPEKITVLNN